MAPKPLGVILSFGANHTNMNTGTTSVNQNYSYNSNSVAGVCKLELLI